MAWPCSQGLGRRAAGFSGLTCLEMQNPFQSESKEITESCFLVLRPPVLSIGVKGDVFMIKITYFVTDALRPYCLEAHCISDLYGSS